MSSVLFDVPGPKARARHRILTVVAILAAAAVAWWVLWKLKQEGEFDARVWESMNDPDTFNAYWQGLLTTLKAAGSAIVLSVLLGGLLAVARLSDHVWFRWPSLMFVQFFRAVPVLLLIIFVYFGAGLGLYWSLVVALTIYNGAVLAEVFRAGIHAVPSGQSEAAYAVGMRKSQVLRLVLLPQSVTIMLPAIISQCVIILKDTALGAIVSFFELVAVSRNVATFIHVSFVPLMVGALIFIAINYSLSRLAIYLERRLSRRTDAAPVKLDPKDDPALKNAGRNG